MEVRRGEELGTCPSNPKGRERLPSQGVDSPANEKIQLDTLARYGNGGGGEWGGGGGGWGGKMKKTRGKNGGTKPPVLVPIC